MYQRILIVLLASAMLSPVLSKPPIPLKVKKAREKVIDCLIEIADFNLNNKFTNGSCKDENVFDKQLNEWKTVRESVESLKKENPAARDFILFMVKHKNLKDYFSNPTCSNGIVQECTDKQSGTAVSPKRVNVTENNLDKLNTPTSAKQIEQPTTDDKLITTSPANQTTRPTNQTTIVGKSDTNKIVNASEEKFDGFEFIELFYQLYTKRNELVVLPSICDNLKHISKCVKSKSCGNPGALMFITDLYDYIQRKICTINHAHGKKSSAPSLTPQSYATTVIITTIYSLIIQYISN